MAADPTTSMVDEECLRVNRSIFTSQSIFELEIEKIFNHSWLYLAHESEIRNPGDYVTRPMGGDRVIVIRGADGAVRAFLNSCRHRGTELCRTDSGNALRLVCPYHAWTYDTTGALRTTSYDQHYGHTSLSKYGLTPVARLGIYRGLIFGTWDLRGQTLEDSLGDVKWYLDILFARTPGGMSIMGPPQRWVIETNWKIPALNFLDAQHALRTHVGPMTMGQESGAPPLTEIVKIVDVVPQLSFPQGHGIVPGVFAPDMPAFFGHPPEMVPLYKQSLSAQQFDHLRESPPSVGTLFPNTSWVQPFLGVAADKPPTIFLSLRNWQPLGPHKVEIWSWYFGEVEASEDWRREMHRTALQTFGMAGIFEEDDAEVWASIMRAIRGSKASREFMDFSAGASGTALEDFGSPGTAYTSLLTEHSQFNFIKRWLEMMGPSADRSRS